MEDDKNDVEENYVKEEEGSGKFSVSKYFNWEGKCTTGLLMWVYINFRVRIFAYENKGKGQVRLTYILHFYVCKFIFNLSCFISNSNNSKEVSISVEI